MSTSPNPYSITIKPGYQTVVRGWTRSDLVQLVTCTLKGLVIELRVLKGQGTGPMKFDDSEEEWIIPSSAEEKILTLTAEYEPKGGEKEKSEVVDHRVARRNYIVDILFCEDGGNGSPNDIDFTDAVVNVRQEIFF